MNTKVPITLLMVMFITFNYCGAHGETTLTKAEEMELETQLNILNKKPLKSFQIEGELYDCIDMHKQPAFDHPLLKNHKIQMKPTSSPISLHGESSLQDNHVDVFYEELQCPKGTIPIRRVRKEDLVRAKDFTRVHLSSIQPLAIHPGYNRAIVRSKPRSDQLFHGASGKMNVINPKVVNDQLSASLIWIEYDKTDADKYSSIQAGWVVSPTLYGDTKTRFFTYWAGKNKGCYNLLCPGFIQVEKGFPIDMILNNTSVYEGDSYTMRIEMHQDNETGNWWLSLPNKAINIGYWPNAIVPNLSNGSERIAWGGYTEASKDGVSPEMGFGKHPDGDYRHSGYFLQLEVDGKEVDSGTLDTLVDSPNCFGVIDGKYQGKEYGHTFTYGGPGGKCGV